jgi:hypothetical protein
MCSVSPLGKNSGLLSIQSNREEFASDAIVEDNDMIQTIPTPGPGPDNAFGIRILQSPVAHNVDQDIK